MAKRRDVDKKCPLRGSNPWGGDGEKKRVPKKVSR